MLSSTDTAPLDAVISSTKTGFIKVNDTFTITCSSKDTVQWTLKVEVDGQIIDASSIKSTTAGQYTFLSSFFKSDQKIRITCVASQGTKVQPSLPLLLSTAAPWTVTVKPVPAIAPHNTPIDLYVNANTASLISCLPFSY